jgi:hypothetical protein
LGTYDWPDTTGMKRIFVLLGIFFSNSVCLLAQDTIPARDTTYWRRTMNLGVNFNQASFSSNWQAGGVNSVALGSLLLGKADYQREQFNLASQLDLQYGVVKNAGQGLRKTVDKILFDAKAGRILSGKWNMFFAANFLTQFAPGFRYERDALGEEQEIRISSFMAPGFLTSSWGMEYRPDQFLWVRLSPFAPRVTFVTDTTLYRNVPANYGVEVGRTARLEWLSSQITTSYDRTFQENLTLKIRYMLYANLETLAFNTIDHRLSLTVTAKVIRHVNVSLMAIGLYDRDQDTRIQFSQTLSLGLLYTLADPSR